MSKSSKPSARALPSSRLKAASASSYPSDDSIAVLTSRKTGAMARDAGAFEASTTRSTNSTTSLLTMRHPLIPSARLARPSRANACQRRTYRLVRRAGVRARRSRMADQQDAHPSPQSGARSRVDQVHDGVIVGPVRRRVGAVRAERSARRRKDERPVRDHRRVRDFLEHAAVRGSTNIAKL